MKIGFLFPGQGSQVVGMGKDLYEKYDIAKDIYEKVKNLTGIDVAKISFEGPDDILNQTKYTQICILTMSLAILEILKKHEINCDISAGLSLGEYSSLIYSNAVSFEEGVKIVQKRGEYMQDLCPDGEWAMSAILGLENSQVEEICKKVTDGFVTPANYNYPGQVVISGDKESIEKAMELAKKSGAKRAVPLKTSGPFHTKKLEQASEKLKEYLRDKEVNLPQLQVVKNLDGKPYTDNDDIKEILAKHVMSPTRMSDSIKYMFEQGVDTFVEIGPGKTLSSFVTSVKKAIGKDAKIININNVESLESAIEELSQSRGEER